MYQLILAIGLLEFRCIDFEENWQIVLDEFKEKADIVNIARYLNRDLMNFIKWAYKRIPKRNLTPVLQGFNSSWGIYRLSYVHGRLFEA